MKKLIALNFQTINVLNRSSIPFHHFKTISGHFKLVCKSNIDFKCQRFNVILITLTLTTYLIVRLNSFCCLLVGSSSGGTIISCPSCRKVFKPKIRELWPLNKSMSQDLTPTIITLQNFQKRGP